MLGEQVAQYLHVAGVGVFDASGVAGTIYVDLLPASPDVCIAILERGGQQASAANPWDYPSIQVIVRGTTDPRTGRDLSERVFDALHGFHEGPLVDGGDYVVSLQCNTSGPDPLGPDGNGRLKYSLNFSAFVVRSH